MSNQDNREMNSQEIREYISQQAGVPVELLTGQTPEEIMQQARQLLDLRQTRALLDQKQGESKATSEQFAEWAKQEMEHEEGMTVRDLFITCMNGPEEQKQQPDPPAYPELHDAGEAQNMPPVKQPIREIFSDYFADNLGHAWSLGKW